jgi:FkbM family methyltransferase
VSWLNRFRRSVTVDGVILPIDRRLSPSMRAVLREGQYETGALDLVRAVIRPDDSVLELGCGLGLVATFCAQQVGSSRVVTYEANPFMAPIIQRTFARNRVTPTLHLAAVGHTDGVESFHVRHNFWASSSHPDRANGSAQTIHVPRVALNRLLADIHPTMLVVDVEGTEDQLFTDAELNGVRVIVMEIHDTLIGDEGRANLLTTLSRHGFAIDPSVGDGRDVLLRRH